MEDTTDSSETKDLEKFLYEIHGWLDDLPSQVQWLNLFLATGTAIKNGDQSAIVFEAFFSKLHGLIQETKTLLKYHFATEKVISELNIQFPENPVTEEYKDMSKAAYLLAESFGNRLSNEEMEVLEYLRNRANHMVLEGYFASYGDNKGPINYHRHGTLKSKVRCRVEKNLASYGGPQSFAVSCFERFERSASVMHDLLAYQVQRHSKAEA